ncbi:hypothetical protein Pint_20278 [Pistacia integerrima]|uniref:Uncharacterized protein n=1 Tax=Pistacia integerrima TaxID=434235 RepID=A0ACC0XDY2_9ROSI|nr:hypothetical protein Pint_20278 [Pistacia integerrima]
MKSFLFPFVLVAIVSSFTSASDPSPLEDFCVAIDDPKNIRKPGNTNNPVGSNVTAVNVQQIPGPNTLGISAVRIDYAPYGQNAPHINHPRATEILVVLEGTLLVGFVTSNPNNTLISKVLDMYQHLCALLTVQNQPTLNSRY